MSQLFGMWAFVAIIGLCLSGSALAQSQSCSDASSMLFDETMLAGTWFEVARNPALNVSCVEVMLSVPQESVLNVNTWYSSSNSSWYMDQNVNYNISLDNSTTGYNVNLTSMGSATAVVKLLSTDYENYAFVCGYTNASDSTTSFGVILTRQQILNSTVISSYAALAAANYTNFIADAMPTISQSLSCSTSGASTAVPAVTAILAAFYALMKLLH